MFANIITALVCRLTGKSCDDLRPSSRDIRAEMKSMSNKAQAQTVELRLQRKQRTGNWQADRYRGIVDPPLDMRHD